MEVLALDAPWWTRTSLYSSDITFYISIKKPPPSAWSRVAISMVKQIHTISNDWPAAPLLRARSPPDLENSGPKIHVTFSLRMLPSLVMSVVVSI